MTGYAATRAAADREQAAVVARNEPAKTEKTASPRLDKEQSILDAAGKLFTQCGFSKFATVPLMLSMIRSNFSWIVS